jgi:hypothetical protein
MHRTLRAAIVATMLCCTALLAAWHVHAETTRVTFPANLDQLVHYTTVTRGNVTEHMLTTRKAIEAVRNRQPIPNGTHVVRNDIRDGRPYRYFIMQNGAGWGADYDARRRTGDWQIRWFWPDKSINTQENTSRCQSCHECRQDDQYLYTLRDLKAFQK